jgi:hypothetical protein
MFGKHLLLTNTISCGVLMAAGDLIQQYIERYRTPTSKPFDWKRTGLCYKGYGKLEIKMYYHTNITLFKVEIRLLLINFYLLQVACSLLALPTAHHSTSFINSWTGAFQDEIL